MPLPKDKTMLRVDSVKFNIALANAELEPKSLAVKAGVSNNVVYTAQKGLLYKAHIFGKDIKGFRCKGG